MLVTLIVIVVLSVIALASIQRGSVEVEAAGLRRRYAAEVSCLDAARELVVSQIVIAGGQIENLSVVRQVGNLELSTGHYDTDPHGQVRTEAGLGNCGSGAGGVLGDLTNRNWGAGMLSSCGVRVPVICRDDAGRALEMEFLVRVGL